jgi:hypothetical protein
VQALNATIVAEARQDSNCAPASPWTSGGIDGAEAHPIRQMLEMG